MATIGYAILLIQPVAFLRAFSSRCEAIVLFVMCCTLYSLFTAGMATSCWLWRLSPQPPPSAMPFC